MTTDIVNVQLPGTLYDKLQELANENQTDPVAVISRLVTAAYQHREWLQELAALRQQIQEEGGLQIGSTKEEVIARLRETRREIFEVEYAHLYR